MLFRALVQVDQRQIVKREHQVAKKEHRHQAEDHHLLATRVQVVLALETQSLDR